MTLRDYTQLALGLSKAEAAPDPVPRAVRSALVQLTVDEILSAAHVGIVRGQIVIAKNWKDTYGEPPDKFWQRHVEGALAEYARCKYAGVYWPGVGVPSDPDCGDGEDVRVTEVASGHLPLHHRDLDDRRYWLLTGSRGTYVVRGSILGKHGKDQRFWKTDIRHPCFMVPQSELVWP